MAAVSPTNRRRWWPAWIVGAILLLAPPSPASADTVEDGQWYVNFLALGDAQKITKGAGVIVGVLDTGVGRHPDLSGDVLNGADARIGGTDRDGRNDRDGHGTRMAGLIGGNGRVRGVAPEATILPVKVMTVGEAYGSIAEGINWAVDHGAKVLCIAIHAGEPALDDEAAIRRAIRSDVVVVAGAGNADGAEGVGYPAAYDGVVAAGGVDRNGRHADISVSGDKIVLSAPSDDISSTEPGGKYSIGTGTSDATALIAGAAALVRAKFPELSAEEVIHRLTYTADDKGPAGRDDEYGYGVVNIVNALSADVPPLRPAAGTSPQAEGKSAGDLSTGTVVAIVTAVLVVVTLLAVLIILGRRSRARAT